MKESLEGVTTGPRIRRSPKMLIKRLPREAKIAWSRWKPDVLLPERQKKSK